MSFWRINVNELRHGSHGKVVHEIRKGSQGGGSHFLEVSRLVNIKRMVTTTNSHCQKVRTMAGANSATTKLKSQARAQASPNSMAKAAAIKPMPAIIFQCRQSLRNAGDGADALNCHCTRDESMVLLPLDHCSFSSIGSLCKALEGAVDGRWHHTSPCEADQYHTLSWGPVIVLWQRSKHISSGSRMQDFGIFTSIHLPCKLLATIVRL